MTAVMRKLRMLFPPPISRSNPQMIAPAARTTPSGQAHGFICQAPIAKASPRPARASQARPKMAPDRPNTSAPSANAPKPANSEPTAPSPARNDRIVMPVGRAGAAAVVAGGVQVVDAGGAADAGVDAGTGAGGAGSGAGGVGSAGVGSVI